MERIKAGITPPSNPRQERLKQPNFPRGEKNSSSVLLAADRLRTSQEGLFAAIRGDLAQTLYSVPKTNLPSNPQQIITVGIASNNNIKTNRMQELVTAHNLTIVLIPDAQEWHTKDVILDATSKAVDAAELTKVSEHEIRRHVRTRPYVILATDQLNAIPVVVKDHSTHLPKIRFGRLGKPNNEESAQPLHTIRKTFQRLADLAKKYQWETVPYIIELATVIHNPSMPYNNGVSVQKSVVFLSRKGVESLVNERFDEYVERVGKNFDIASIAGGFELKVLEEMDIVQYITDSPNEVKSTRFPLEQPAATRDRAYALALGHADEHLIRDYFS